MFGGVEDEDDSFFTPIPSSNLASLFGANMMQTNSNLNTSLTYTAPKQPVGKAEETSKPSPTKTKYQSSIILFKEVHAFKLIEKNYSTQGKCGLALIGNDSVHIYQLLLYKHKNDIISTSKVSSQFNFTVQKDNYVSFFDDQKINWTVHFYTESDLNDFAHVIETREAKVIRNIPKPETAAKPQETSLPKRDLFKDVKGHVSPSPITKETKQEVDSDNQSDSSGANTRAVILSRMAKMGQRILLPNATSNTVSDGTDSNDETDKASHKVDRKIKRAVSPKNSSIETSVRTVTKPVPSVPQTAQTVATCPPQQFVVVNGQYVPVMQPQVMPIQSSSFIQTSSTDVMPTQIMYAPPANYASDQLNMFFVENRTHNSEVRMNVLRLTNKVEEMLEKVNKLDSSSVKLSSEVNNLTENENLKSTVISLERNVADLRSQNEEYQKENVDLQNQISNLTKEIAEKKIDIELNKKCESEYIKKIEQMDFQIKDQSFELSNLEEKLSNAAIENSVEKIAVNKDKFSNIDETIKRIMNEFYHEVNNQFSDDTMIEGKEVKKVLAKKVIDNTYNIIAAVKELTEPKDETQSS